LLGGVSSCEIILSPRISCISTALQGGNYRGKYVGVSNPMILQKENSKNQCWEVELYSLRYHGSQRSSGRTRSSIVDRSSHRKRSDLMLHALTIWTGGRKSQRLVSGSIDFVTACGGRTDNCKCKRLKVGRTT